MELLAEPTETRFTTTQSTEKSKRLTSCQWECGPKLTLHVQLNARQTLVLPESEFTPIGLQYPEFTSMLDPAKEDL